MTTLPTPHPNAARLKRTYDASPELIWELLTTTAGLEQWWAPDGFETRVSELELRPGGQVRYTMPATGPEQVAFMRDTGNPLSAEVKAAIMAADVLMGNDRDAARWIKAHRDAAAPAAATVAAGAPVARPLGVPAGVEVVERAGSRPRS